jgi:WD40 repeat protein
MSKSRFLAVISVTLSTAWAATVVQAAEPVVQIEPSRVIELVEQGRSEKVPVISSIALDAAGRLLATSGDDHLVRIWNVQQGELIRRLDGHADWVRSVVFSPDGRMLATAGDDRRIKLWNMASDRPHPRAVRSQPRAAVLRFVSIPVPDWAVHALALSGDGGMLAAAGFAKTVRIHDARSGALLWELDARDGDIRALAFSPDGAQLAAAGRRGPIRVWTTADGRHVHDLVGHRRRVWALAYSPDGTRLASAGEGRDVRLWDTGTGELMQTLPPRRAKILALAFCSAGRLAVGGSDNVIRVWDLADRRERFELVGHTGSVTALTWDASDGMLLSGSFDTTVRLWQLPAENVDRISGAFHRSGGVFGPD